MKVAGVGLMSENLNICPSCYGNGYVKFEAGFQDCQTCGNQGEVSDDVAKEYENGKNLEEGYCCRVQP